MWQIDPAHTQVEFVVTHMMFAKVRGGFNTFSGTLVQGDDGDLASGIWQLFSQHRCIQH